MRSYFLHYMATILSIKDAIEKAITKTKIGSEYRTAVLKATVRELVGSMAVEYISYISVKQNVLFIKTTSSSLKSQLLLSKSLLFDKINAAVGPDLAVQDLRIL